MSEEEHPGYATVVEVATLYGLRPQQVYRLAHQHGWRTYFLDGRARYHRDDVAATMGSGNTSARRT